MQLASIEKRSAEKMKPVLENKPSREPLYTFPHIQRYLYTFSWQDETHKKDGMHRSEQYHCDTIGSPTKENGYSIEDA